MLKRVLIPALTLALSVLGLLPASSAHADTTTSLPNTGFYQIVADTAHSHLFLSQGSGKNGIIVTGLAGQQVTTIAGQDGVKGLALSPDGSTLYAALASSHAVSAIDTATLQQTASYPLGNGNTPADVAVQSGKVWVSYDTGTAGQAAIGDIDLSAATPTFQTQAAMGGWYSAPYIAADPHDTGVLVAAEPGESPSTVASYDVSADPATATVQPTRFQNCENESDLVVTPGGSQFILACGWPYAHYRYSTADLSQQGAYASTNYPDAVAIDANGDVAAGTEYSSSSPDLYIYHPGGDVPLNAFNLASSRGLAARGLAWSADGSQLFAVLQTSTGGYSLQVIDEPMLTRSALTLTGPSTAYITKTVTLTGSLTLGSGTTPPAGTPITVTRSVTGGADKTFNIGTAADGSYTLTDTPPAVGQYTYAARYSGDANTAPATASQTVNVTLIPTSLTVTTGSTVYTYQPTVRVTAHLGTTYSNRTVSIYAQPFGGTKSLLKTGTVDSSGNLTVSYTAPHNTTFSAVFSGDQRYAPATVTQDIYVRAKVSESISGYYSQTSIGGITYRLYHHTALLKANATVAPNKSGGCVEFEVQEHYQGAWRPNVITGCIKLSSSSKASTTFGLTKADIGYHYRIRADYIARDITNGSNHSAWRYLIVNK